MSNFADHDLMYADYIEDVRKQASDIRRAGECNFVEITRLPKKIDSRTLASLIITASKIVPAKVDICIRQDGYGIMQQVGLVKFRKGRDALQAVARMKATAYGRSWDMKIISNPELSKPSDDVMSHCIE